MSSEAALFWFFVSLIALILIVILHHKMRKNLTEQMRQALVAAPNFDPSQTFYTHDLKVALAIDKQRKKIGLVKSGLPNLQTFVFSHRDLLAAELFVDGSQITKTARTSQLGSALIGGIAFGGVGAAVGGLTGKRRSSEKVDTIDLRISVNSTTDPVHDISFMPGQPKELKKGGLIYNDVHNRARHWHGLIETLINAADREDHQSETDATPTDSGREDKANHTDAPNDADQPKGASNSDSAASEIKKLFELKQQGAITQAEYEAQKNSLLRTDDK